MCFFTPHGMLAYHFKLTLWILPFKLLRRKFLKRMQNYKCYARQRKLKWNRQPNLTFVRKTVCEECFDTTEIQPVSYVSKRSAFISGTVISLIYSWIVTDKLNRKNCNSSSSMSGLSALNGNVTFRVRRRRTIFERALNIHWARLLLTLCGCEYY